MIDLGQLLERARFWLQRRRRSRELDEEIKLHLDLRIQRNIDNGMALGEASQSALQQFGSALRVKEDSVEIWISRWFDQLWHDLKFGARWLKRSPGFTAAVVCTLGIGIGVNTAMFSVVNAVLLQPLPYPEPDKLIWIANWDSGCTTDCFNSRADFLIWSKDAPSLEATAAYGNLDLAIESDGQSTAERIAFVTPEFWRLSGARPKLGRLPSENESNALVISWGLFERQFGGNADVIGKIVRIEDRPFQIAGVLPREFRFLFPQQIHTGDEIRDIDAYTLIANGFETPGDPMRPTARSGPVPGWVRVIARLKEGRTVEQARAELRLIHDRLNKEYPSLFRKKVLNVLPLMDRIVGNARLPLLVLLGAVVFVLVISCVNVANLLMVRASSRRKEIAIRAALGAGKQRMLRQFVAESMLLTAMGGLAGLGLARLTLFAVIQLGSQAVLRVADTVIDTYVLMFTISVTILTAVLFGLAPASTLVKENLEEVLREDGKGSSASMGQQKLRATLVSLEIALAMVLLTGAGLMMRSFWRMNTYPPGFAPEKVLVMKLSLASGKYGRNRPMQEPYLRQLLETIESLPGVEAVGIDCGSINQAVIVESPELALQRLPSGAKIRAVSAGYLPSLGTVLTRGSWPSTEQAFDTVLVNQSLAFQTSGALQDVIGKRIDASFIRGTIGGVIANFKDQQLDAQPAPEVYIPYQRAPVIGAVRAVIRVNVDPQSMIAPVRSRVSAIDRSVPIYRLQTLEQDLYNSLAPRRFNLYLLGAFAATALLLALIGIYGVISFIVVQRTREIGIRVALGAGRREIIRMVGRYSMRIAFIGVSTGFVLSLLFSRVMASMIYDVDTTDPTTLLAVALTLTLTAFLACFRPAYRAALLDPLVALRTD